jgi:hypothetical protein
MRKERIHSPEPGSQTWYKAVGNILTPASTWHTPNAPVVSRKDIMFLKGMTIE